MQQVGNTIFETEKLNIRDHIWFKRGEHNHIRISQIIRSLLLCRQPEFSFQFRKVMFETAEQFGEVNKVTKGYWLKANQ